MAGRRKKADFAHLQRSSELANALRRHRCEVLNISRNELSKASGVSAASIQAIEDGRTVDPGVFTVMALAVAMHLDISGVLKSLTGSLNPRPLYAPEASA